METQNIPNDAGVHRRKEIEKRCECGMCGGKTFIGHPNRKYHEDCIRAVHVRQSLQWNKTHPEKMYEAGKRYRKTERGKLMLHRTRSTPRFILKRSFKRMHTEGLVHEFIVATAVWRAHYGEPIVIHDRRTLKRDEFSPKGTMVKEIDIYIPSRKIGYDVKSYHAYSDDERSLTRPLTESERKRIAERLGVTIIELPYGFYQQIKDFERQDCFSKIINDLAANNTIAPPSGMVGDIHAVEGIEMNGNIIRPAAEVHMPIFPVHISRSRKTAVAHPNGHVYVGATGDRENELRFMQYSYVHIVDDIEPYIEMENVELLKQRPEALITDTERAYMDELRAEVERVYTPEELPITLFTDGDPRDYQLSGFIVKSKK